MTIKKDFPFEMPAWKGTENTLAFQVHISGWKAGNLEIFPLWRKTKQFRKKSKDTGWLLHPPPHSSWKAGSDCEGGNGLCIVEVADTHIVEWIGR